MKFYYIDENYLKYLQSIDKNVSQKTKRMYIDFILIKDEYKYFIPLTSKEKKNNRGYLKMIDNDCFIGGIRFSNAIPVKDNNS